MNTEVRLGENYVPFNVLTVRISASKSCREYQRLSLFSNKCYLVLVTHTHTVFLLRETTSPNI